MPGLVMLFGGEVSPSDIGHEGAGGFANDLIGIDPRSLPFFFPSQVPYSESVKIP